MIGSSSDNIWIVGDNGAIARGNGTTRISYASGTTQSLNAIWGSGPSDVLTPKTSVLTTLVANWQVAKAV